MGTQVEGGTLYRFPPPVSAKLNIMRMLEKNRASLEGTRDAIRTDNEIWAREIMRRWQQHEVATSPLRHIGYFAVALINFAVTYAIVTQTAYQTRTGQNIGAMAMLAGIVILFATLVRCVRHQSWRDSITRALYRYCDASCVQLNAFIREADLLDDVMKNFQSSEDCIEEPAKFVELCKQRHATLKERLQHVQNDLEEIVKNITLAARANGAAPWVAEAKKVVKSTALHPDIRYALEWLAAPRYWFIQAK